MYDYIRHSRYGEVSFKILAAIHAGILTMSCQDCQHDPELKIAWGCESPTQIAVWEDEEEDTEYYSCPFQFIPVSIMEWYQEYAYYKEFSGAAPRYWDQGEKWLDIASLYSKYYADFIIKEQQRKSRQTAQPRMINGQNY